MAGDNPLASNPRKPTVDHPHLVHAKVWRHVSTMPHHEMPGKIAQIDATLPTLGALAGNPNVKAKDVIKAAASAAADGTITPSDAVRFVTQIPSDPEKVQPWLKTLYVANLSAAVHMKAAMIQKASGQQPQPQQPQAPPQ